MSTSLMYVAAAVVTLLAVRARIEEVGGGQAGGWRLEAGGRSGDGG
jgi:hypothetical protein